MDMRADMFFTAWLFYLRSRACTKTYEWPNKLEYYITLARICLPGTNTLALWVHL